MGHRVLEGSSAEVHLFGGWRERPRPHPLARYARSADHIRRRGTPARRVLRPAQHRYGLERQHLCDRDVSRAARAKVRLQRPWAGHQRRSRCPVADSVEKIAGNRGASEIFDPWERFGMKKIRMLFVVALMAVSSLANAQDSMKKG